MPRFIVDLTAAEFIALKTLGLNPVPAAEQYAAVEFEGASRSYTYRIPQGLTVKVGDRVTVDKGVYANGSIGTVRRISNTPPPSSYVYNIKAVA